ncbi:hypothetical protein XENOCAPTIV_011881 [Xenoophorus captivus]|uniref:Uncharacterized protein n=1 Tax=Xenoophorus captivus TaxID=1517983 RepID=A0ABV0SC14_9TELE
MSRIPVRRAGSSDTPLPHIKASSTLSGDKEVSSTMKVLKLLRPGLHRHQAISGMFTHLASRTLLGKNTDKSPNYRTEAITEATAEMDGTAEQVRSSMLNLRSGSGGSTSPHPAWTTAAKLDGIPNRQLTLRICTSIGRAIEPDYTTMVLYEYVTKEQLAGFDRYKVWLMD